METKNKLVFRPAPGFAQIEFIEEKKPAGSFEMPISTGGRQKAAIMVVRLLTRLQLVDKSPAVSSKHLEPGTLIVVSSFDIEDVAYDNRVFHFLPVSAVKGTLNEED